MYIQKWGGGGPRKRPYDADDPEFLEAAAKANWEAEKDADAVRYVAVNEIFAAQNLSALQHWEDGTPNVRGQLTSLWVLGERPRREPIRYAPPPLPEPEPPCCSAPTCFQPGCGPWGGPGLGFRAQVTEPGSDYGKDGGRNLDDFVDLNDSGSEDEYDRRGKADNAMDAACAPFVGAAVGAVSGASTLLKKVKGGCGGPWKEKHGREVDPDIDLDDATLAMVAEQKAAEERHKEIQAERDRYHAARRTERALQNGGCLGGMMRHVLRAMGRKPLGPPPPPTKLVALAAEKEQKEQEEATAAAAAAAADKDGDGETAAAASNKEKGGEAEEEKDDYDDDEVEWGKSVWKSKRVGYLLVRKAVLDAWHPPHKIEVSFERPSIQLLSILAAATSPFMWRLLRLCAPFPPGVTGRFEPPEFELLSMAPSEVTRGEKEARLEAMTHRKLPYFPSIERDVFRACLACCYLSFAAHISLRQGRKPHVFFFVAMLPGFRRAVAVERTRLARRRRALRKCAFLSTKRRAKVVKTENWKDIEMKRPEPKPKTVEELRAQMEAQWNAPPPPGESLADRLARQKAAEEKAAAAEAAAAATRKLRNDVKVKGDISEKEKTETTTAEGGGGGLASQLWGMLAGVDWAGMGADVGGAALDGAGAVGAALGEVEVSWSSQVNPDNDTTSTALYDASVARALKSSVKRHHRATRGLKTYWPGIEALDIEEGKAYKARSATERDDDDTDRPIGPLPPRIETARA